MSNYTKATNFTAKDTLPTGNSGKIIKGTEIDVEFTAIASAVASKADSNSPTFTGTPTAPTASAETNNTQLATTAFVTTAVTTATGSLGTLSTQDADDVEITGGSITGITDLAVADGGTGLSTLTSGSVLVGNGTSAVSLVAPGDSGNILKSNGTTWTSGTIDVSPTLYILAASEDGTATRDVTLSAGTWQIVLQDGGARNDLSNHDFTVTRVGSVGDADVTTSYHLYRSGGAGFGREVNGFDMAVGSLTVDATDTYTMSIAAPSVSGSGAPTRYAGATLFVSKIS